MRIPDFKWQRPVVGDKFVSPGIIATGKSDMDVFGDREFWVSFLAAGVDFHACESLGATARRIPADREDAVALEFPAGYRLRLQTHCEGHDLYLANENSGDSTELGRMDCHQMSDAFRYEEYKLLTKRCRTEPSWAVRIILLQYLGPTSDTVQDIVIENRAALSESGVFTAHEIEHIANYSTSIVRQNFVWARDEKLGWIGILTPNAHDWEFPYTLRTSRNTDINFSLVQDFFGALTE